ncbi:MAG: sulfatase-like hydrolase/transferase [Deltaproteobacteria bacterium]|nr:sulfatase-like hydrolase/transferase [Deltaproteobacteria bacterium]
MKHLIKNLINSKILKRGISTYLFFSITLFTLFFINKIILAFELDSVSYLTPVSFVSDMITALVLGFLAFTMAPGRVISFILIAVYSALSTHVAIAAGDFLDTTTFKYAKSVGAMTDSATASLPYTVYIFTFVAIVAYVAFFERKLLKIFLNFKGFKEYYFLGSFLTVASVLFFIPVSSHGTPLLNNPVGYIALDAISTKDTLHGEKAVSMFNQKSKYSNKTANIPIKMSGSANLRVHGKTKYNVVIFLMESTSYLSMMHMEKKIMPAFEQLKSDGVFLENFYANVPLSLKSILALHSGCYPAANWKYISKSRPRIPLKTMPAYFKENGYNTALLHGGTFKFSHKLEYFKGRGYDLMYDANNIPGKGKYEHTSWGIDDLALFDYSKKWIKQNKNKNKPFLLTFIPISPHGPYHTPKAWKIKKFVKDEKQNAYFNAIMYIDSLMLDFIKYLKANNLYDNTIIIAMGDHGEAFNQHPQDFGHSYEIYEENVHVPAVISNPELFSKPQVATVMGHHGDILPTLLDMLNFKQHFYGNGVSLIHPPENRFAFLYTGLRGKKLGLRDGDYKYILRPKDNEEEIYNLKTDPYEKHNLVLKLKERTKYYKGLVLKWGAYTENYIKNVNMFGQIVKPKVAARKKRVKK